MHDMKGEGHSTEYVCVCEHYLCVNANQGLCTVPNVNNFGVYSRYILCFFDPFTCLKRYSVLVMDLPAVFVWQRHNVIGFYQPLLHTLCMRVLVCL